MISKDNKLVKKALKLKQKKYRESENLFIAEGIRFVECAIENNSLEYILYSSKLYSTSGYERVLDSGVDTYEIEESVLESICDTVNPQGVIGVCRKSLYEVEDALGNLVAIIDGVQDPGNMGTIIRTCDAAGVSGIVILKGTVDIYNPKVLRSTMGSIFHMPIVHIDSLLSIKSRLDEKNYNILATSLEAKSSLYDYDFSNNTAFILGNEANGVSSESFSLATDLIIIPMEGSAESLNVGVANGVIVYEALRQKISRG
ncbi:TrmH family RNA methyltransferase [Clostridium sp.]|uniref:TrmH family RNA methyltransferase n=1 Tax=Clostridium sp. TaxID=1506 RepID=UPI002FCC9542